jgi:WD40 repeat protein
VTAGSRSFYCSGGTVPWNAPSYIVRSADTELVSALQSGEYAYVLTSRQMGKSSLMVRAAHELRRLGRAVAVVDLTAFGRTSTSDQWYRAIALRIGRELGMEDEVDLLWEQVRGTGPVDLFMRILPQLCRASGSSQLVIFFDEIDVVRSLPFPADDLFAAVRACHNCRSEEPEQPVPIFCLLGAATPSQLIQDVRTTPFNVGRRIELTDFTQHEARQLTRGMECEPEVAALLLDRVLYWTGGQPYLTQRLCQAVACNPDCRSAGAVDELCGQLFLKPSSKMSDSNLQFARERLLRGESAAADVLQVYDRILKRRRIRDDPTDPVICQLVLAGVAVSCGDTLCPRNRLYETAFDRRWVRANLPGAERRRQRAAFLRGASLTVALSALILSAITSLYVRSIRAERLARAAMLVARTQRDRMRQALYAANLDLAQRAIDANDTGRAIALLDACAPARGDEDLRGFEWRYLRHIADSSERTLTVGAPVAAVGFSGDGDIACAAADGTVTRWSASGATVVSKPVTGPTGMLAVCLSRDSRHVAYGFNFPARLKVVAVGDGRATSMSMPPDSYVHEVKLTDDLRRATLSMGDGSVWQASLGPAGRARQLLPACSGAWITLAVSRDGGLVAATDGGRRIRAIDLATGRIRSVELRSRQRITALAYSAANWLAAGSLDGVVQVFRPGAGKPAMSISGLPGRITCLEFSPSGKSLAAGTAQGPISIIEVATGAARRLLRGHHDRALSIAFSPDERSLASGSADGTARVWSLTPPSNELRVPMSHQFLTDGRLSANGDVVAAWDGAAARAWSHAGPVLQPTLSSHQVGCPFELSNDGEWLVSASREDRIDLWSMHPHPHLARGIRTSGPQLTAAISSGTGAVAICDNNAVRLYDVRTGGLIRTLPRTQITECAAFSPDGSRLAAGGHGEVTVWSVREPHPLFDIRSAENGGECVLFSPDGRCIASTGPDRTLTMVDSATGAVLWTAEARGGHLYALAFSPDGKTLASAGSDRTIRLWSAETGSELAQIRGHLRDICALAFSSDGNVLRSMDQGGEILAWLAPR